ncbi:MAG: hypothetical protein H6Q19_1124 [Bacteroidetes bacterium]|nr:hypothetical protein [Bacteroidota bacterium]
MKMLFLVLIPLFALVVYKRIKFIVADVKDNNHSKLKADIFLFILQLILIVLISRIILTW